VAGEVRPMGTTVAPAEHARRLLLAVQVGDAVACAIPLAIIRRDLTRLGCPPALQRAIPVVKAASAVGLVAGRRDPRIGRLTTDALVAYFVCALAAHGRVRDPAWRWAAATGMLGLTVVARRSYTDPEVIDLVDDQPEIDLTAPEAQPDASAPVETPSAQMS
jgi:hypothetical protein